MKIILVLLFEAGSVLAWAQAPSDEAGKAFPLEERWQHYVHRTYSWQRLGMLGVDTAIDHILEEPHEWGRRPRSFTYRYSSAMGQRVVRNSIELGAGILLGEDARFKPSHEHGFFRRLRFASENALLGRNRHGQRRVAFSRMAASAGGIAVSSTWYPCRRALPEQLLQGMGSSYLGHLQNSLLTEFSPDLLRFGKKVRDKLAFK